MLHYKRAVGSYDRSVHIPGTMTMHFSKVSGGTSLHAREWPEMPKEELDM